MKNVIQSILILFIFPFYTHSQCISGDCENGTGVYISKDKTRMEGNWKSGQLNGASKIFFSSGATYDGNMIMGIKSGFGKYIYSNGNYYEGNWKNNKQYGAGKYVTIKGYVEEGNYINDTLVGLVNVTYTSGDKYVGYWKNGKQNGAGKYMTAKGNSEEGKYTNDTLSGFATLMFSNGDKYIGYVSDSQFDGNGIYYSFGGDKFEGNWKNGKKNGAGTLYYAKGGTLKGSWIDNVFVSGSNKIQNDNPAKTINPILGNGNVYEVNVLLNNILKLDMVFDTGASEVLFTPDVVLTLIRGKTITEEDLLEGKMFMDANGNLNNSVRFNLKTLKIGEITLENIPCAISNNIEGMNLLGLSALKKLGSFEFDFNKSIIKVK